MNFQKYPSIENTRFRKVINQIKDEGFDQGPWEVSNKIHGANFSLWYDGTQVQFARRTSFIITDDHFYNFESIRERLEGYAQRVWNLILGQTCFSPPPKEMVIYGELFGNIYPGMRSSGKGVQNNIYYSPELQFYAFDLKVDDIYWGTDTRLEIFQQAQVPYAPILFRGSFEECLEFDTIFEDPIYQDFGLPRVEGNYSEGVVLKPCSARFLKSGSRVILKNKNPQHFEKKEKKSKKPKQKGPTNQKLDPQVEEQVANLEQFVTENRLRNVLSKMGPVTKADLGQVIKEFNQDLLEDYFKEYWWDFHQLDKSDQKLVTSRTNKTASHLVRSRMFEIINGDF